MNDLYCLSFSPKKPMNISEKLYNATYEMWVNVWRDSYKYFGWDPKSVCSDQWVRQDLVLGFYQGNTPIGAAFFDEKNLRAPLFYDDSFFRMWPKNLLEEISRWPSSDKALICTNFTIAPDFRKKTSGTDYKAILHGLSLKQFVDMGNPFMIGTTVKKSMSDISVVNAAHLLKENVEEKGLIVDLLYWKREEMKDFRFPKYHDQIETIWNANARDYRRAA